MTDIRTNQAVMGESSVYLDTTNRVSAICMAGNIVLTLFKIAAGVIGHSRAMVSDAVHSFSDVLGEIIVLVGVSLSEKKADRDHPYGHERMENIASLTLALILALTGFLILRSAFVSILTGSYQTAPVPGKISLYAAVISILVKEGMFRYTMSAAGRISSGALKAEAWHHRSDALSSVGSLAGIVGARLGLRILDPAAGLVISIFILKAAWDICKDSLNGLVDHSGGETLEKEIRSVVMNGEGILGIDLLHTREFGRKIYVDLEVSMDKDISLELAHARAEKLHDILEQRFPDIKHVMIHVNPYYGDR